jgi:ankyrin repeat protein
MVRLLLSSGVDVKGKKGGHSLRMAAQAGHVDIMKTLIQAGVNLNAADNAKSTAMHWWCISGKHDLEALRLLLSSGANVNAVDKWRRTPIMLLLTPGNEIPVGTLLSALRTLVDAGADLKKKNDYGDTAMSLGLGNSKTEVASFFRYIQSKK